MRSFFRLLLTATLLLPVGCATRPEPEAVMAAQSAALTRSLASLSPRVAPAEAARAAAVAIRYPLELAAKWHVVRPALFNNVLINTGIHPQGLCFQWADALTVKLMTLHLSTLELHRGVARLGTRREHSCVVLTASGQNFTNGIALDAWRHGGRLNWSPVLTDKYPWREVKLIPSYQAKLQAAAEKMQAPAGPP